MVVAGPESKGRVMQPRRNEACPCGSGKKYKDCHESAGSSFLEALARAENKKKLRELRLRLKEQGVPWYKRFFYRQ